MLLIAEATIGPFLDTIKIGVTTIVEVNWALPLRPVGNEHNFA
jgi:hypothetical protein